MKTKFSLQVLKTIVALSLLLLPLAASADSVHDGMIGFCNTAGFSCGSGLSGSTTLTQLIANAVRIMLTIAGGVAVVFVIIGGYQYMTSAGNEEQAVKGKKTLINAIIGIIVIVLSYVIINVIVNLVSGTGSFFGIF